LLQDFEGYVTKTLPWGQGSGIAKIIPPEGWTRALPPITKRSLADIRIKKPIQQIMLGGAGQFRQTNVEKARNKPLTLQQWFEKSQQRSFAAPGPKDLDRTLDRDSQEARAQRAAEEEARRTTRSAKRAKKEDSGRQKLGRIESEAIQVELGDPIDGDVIEDGLLPVGHLTEDGAVRTPQAAALDAGSTGSQAVAGGDADSHEISGDTVIVETLDPVPALDPTSAASPQSSSDPLVTTPQPELVPEWYETFDPMESWLQPGTKVDDYTPEACAAMERKFWKNMGLGEPSWYGADLLGGFLVANPIDMWLNDPQAPYSKM